jgi:site-specific DNA-adenine methylase
LFTRENRSPLSGIVEQLSIITNIYNGKSYTCKCPEHTILLHGIDEHHRQEGIIVVEMEHDTAGTENISKKKCIYKIKAEPDMQR